MPDVQEAIQAMLKGLQAPRTKRPRVQAQRTICISRDEGSGGDRLARQLAERLGLALYDRAIIDRIAERLGGDPATLRAIDSSSADLRDLWIYSLVTGQSVDADEYRRQLVNLVLSLGRCGGVILGRGAHLILARSGALRVRVVGSPEPCARRIAEAEGLNLDIAARRVEEVNRRRNHFVKEHFHVGLDDARTFDLVINTDQMNDFARLENMLVDAATMAEAAAAQH